MIHRQSLSPVAVLLISAALVMPNWMPSGASAQETAPAADTAPPVETGADDGLLGPDALDELFAPVALYPDALLAQILLAATYPIDVVKADLFLQKNKDKTPQDVSDLIALQDWPEPVKGLAAGFPDLIGRMVEHIDWTEMTGNALIAQTDDSLASLQRLRAQAKLNGYLEDNAAMNVEESETGAISIAPADSEVIYVPQYSSSVYTTPAPATPYYVTDDDDWGDALATGAIVLGGAVILDEIFDDDWDNDWNDYWDGDRPGGGNQIDWDGDINIDNGINIGNGNIDRTSLGEGARGEGNLGGAIAGGVAGGIAGGALNRPATRPGIESGRLGDVSDARLQSGRDGNFRPSDASRDAAREKISRQTASGGSIATLPAAAGKGDRVGKPSTRPTASATPKRSTSAKPAAQRSSAAKPKVSKPKSTARPSSTANRKSSASRSPSYKPSSGSRAKASSSRGGKSRGGRR
jgi:hypothetical protein